jgi:hypothetical protein
VYVKLHIELSQTTQLIFHYILPNLSQQYSHIRQDSTLEVYMRYLHRLALQQARSHFDSLNQLNHTAFIMKFAEGR